MDEEEVSASPVELNDSNYPMYFGVSCAFVALHLMLRARRVDVEHSRWSQMGEMMLQGSAHLLGLMVGRAQRRVEDLELGLKRAESEVWELERQRAQDAKTKNKVMAIFAAHEQSWIAEKQQLQLQIQSLLSELHTVETKNKEVIFDLSKIVEEDELVLRIKDEALEEEAEKRKEVEEKLQMAEEVMEELSERVKKEALDHSSELWKHKTAFVELASNQRQLEAELGRALQQAEVVKQELDEVFDQKQEAVSTVEKLSREIMKLQQDTDQKDKIISAMLRKSKFDTAEKQMLLKEVKTTKAVKKQAELDSERWKNMWESRHKNLRSSKFVDAGTLEERRPDLQSSGYHPRMTLREYLEADSHESTSTKGENYLDQYTSKGTNELVGNDIQHLQDWVRLDMEKYVTSLEQRHFAEIEAFMEQMLLKDDKLEAFHWQLRSLETESKRLQSHIEGLDGDLSQLRGDNLKLEALLLDREEELNSQKRQLNFHAKQSQKAYSRSTSWASDHQALWSELKITEKIPKQKEQETKAIIVRSHHSLEKKIQEGDDRNPSEEINLMHLYLQHKREPVYRESEDNDIMTTSSNEFLPPTNYLKHYPIIYVNELSSEEQEVTENSSEHQAESTTFITQISDKEIEEEKELCYRVHVPVEKTFTTKDSSWKMDIHALGVSYKIKRLERQLVVLEKDSGGQAMKQTMITDDTPDGSERKVNKNSQQIRGLPPVISVLDKQLKRYKSLEEKIDDLSRRMHKRTRSRRDAQNGRTTEQTETLESFLEETFRLQRYMVAAGQNLMDIQARITCSFADSEGFDESAGFNLWQFANIIRNLFREIQRGLEVRIAQIIGDIEGTLACDGILHR